MSIVEERPAPRRLGTTALHSAFVEQAARTPKTAALRWNGDVVDYAALERRSRAIRTRLQREGVRPGDLVGVCIRRGPDLVASLLGVLRCGAIYVPLDPAYPVERIRFILDDAAARVVVTDATTHHLVADGAARPMAVESIDDLDTDDPDDALGDVEVDPSDPGYAIYTSGSTGRPKGVLIAHANAMALVRWGASCFDADELSGVLASTSVCFDLSIFELFVPLAVGGTIVIVDNVLELPATADRDRVRLVLTVPSAMTQLLQTSTLPSSITTVLLAGEPLQRSLADRVYACPSVERVWNLYGPSEDTTFSTCALVPPDTDEEPSIGVPLDEREAWILDESMSPVAPGELGEIYVGGAGVTIGYLARPGLTADRFVPDHLSGRPGARLYRTGDLGRRLTDGNIHYVGRVDHQVKIRGFRIELGEIEATLSKHASVAGAVVVTRPGPDDELKLVAFVEPTAGHVVEPSALREFVGKQLPAHMVPHLVSVLPHLPLTPNNKIDRAALPEAVFERSADAPEPVAPTSAVEADLVATWEALLGISPIGTHDGFFEIGGDSLTLARMLARVAEAHRAVVTPRTFRSDPTIAALAASIESAEAGTGAVVDVGPQAQRLARSSSSVGEHVEMTAIQRDFWFHDQMTPGVAQYNIPARFRLTGAVTTAAIAQGLDRLVEHHEALRTAYVEVEGEPRAVLGAPYGVAVEHVDLRHLPATERSAAAASVEADAARRPIDVATGQLVRALHVVIDDDTSELIVVMHHIAADGWSIGVVANAVADAMAPTSAAAIAPMLQQRDYNAWREATTAARKEQLIQYWRDRLGTHRPAIDLPHDHARPPIPSYRGERISRRVAPELLDGLTALAATHQTSLSVALLTVLDVLVSRLGSDDQVAVGVQVADRGWPSLDDSVGCYLQTVPVKVSVDRRRSFTDLLRTVDEHTSSDLEHGDLSLGDIVTALGWERSVSHAAAIQVTLSVQSYAAAWSAGDGAPVEYLQELDNGSSKTELTVYVDFGGEGPTIDAEYSTDLYTGETIERWLDLYVAMIGDAVERPDAPVSDLGRRAIGDDASLHQVNDTATDDGPTRCLHELIFETADRRADRIAVSVNGDAITYGELTARSSAIAAHLRAHGVGSEDVVAVCTGRSHDMIVGLLGVMAAGGAYLPLDPDFPADRLAYMLDDSRAVAIVADEHNLQQFAGADLPVIDVSSVAAGLTSIAGGPGAGETPRRADVDGLAYILYTSGSTGRPKGVEITHRSIVNLLQSMARAPGMDHDDVVAAVTTMSFDIAAVELWLPLMVGARIVLVDSDTSLDGQRLADVLTREEVTVMQAAPVVWRVLCGSGWHGRRELRAWCGGEALTNDLAEQLLAQTADVWNLYGPTETTVWSTIEHVTSVSPEGGSAVSIGRPIDNTQIWVLDDDLQPVPIGVRGELYIGGIGVARCYRGRPGLTAERFVPDPFGDAGGRLYRTGDEVRLRSDGRLDFLGRSDSQVKLNGLRIELGEVEAAFTALPEVAMCAAAVRGDGPDDRRLVAYVVAADRAEIEPAAIRRAVGATLPRYLVPSQIELVDELVLTSNRKIDRGALPEPSATHIGNSADDRGDAREPQAPQSPIETIVAEEWAGVLGVAAPRLDDDFFLAGGHSLLATRLVSRLGQRFDLKIPVRVIFEDSTLRRLAARVERLLLEDLDIR